MAHAGKEKSTLVVRCHTAKKSLKGEDFALNEPDLSWPREPRDACIKFGYFGVFDGHGGQGAPLLCKQDLLRLFLDAMDDLAGDAAKVAGVSLLDVWMAHVGPALVDAFESCHVDACAQDDSGATATVVLVVAQPEAEARRLGLDCPEAFVVCANVGDSHAFLYTGVQTLRLNADHRLDANKLECERVKAVPGSSIDNQETRSEKGPARLYPGGLMMSRTIGDRSAPAAIATPEVRIAYLPPCGGRVVLASDGLWDIASGKQAAKLCHGKPCQPASQFLVATAQRKDSRDDITVTVVDVLPWARRSEKLPWSLPNGLPCSNTYLSEVEDAPLSWDPLQLQLQQEESATNTSACKQLQLQKEGEGGGGGFEGCPVAPSVVAKRACRVEVLQRVLKVEANRAETERQNRKLREMMALQQQQQQQQQEQQQQQQQQSKKNVPQKDDDDDSDDSESDCSDGSEGESDDDEEEEEEEDGSGDDEDAYEDAQSAQEAIRPNQPVSSGGGSFGVSGQFPSPSPLVSGYHGSGCGGFGQGRHRGGSEGFEDFFLDGSQGSGGGEKGGGQEDVEEDEWTLKPKKLTKKTEAVLKAADSAVEKLLEVLLSDAARLVAGEQVALRKAEQKAEQKRKQKELQKLKKEKRRQQQEQQQQQAEVRAAAEAAAQSAAMAAMGGATKVANANAHTATNNSGNSGSAGSGGKGGRGGGKGKGAAAAAVSDRGVGGVGSGGRVAMKGLKGSEVRELKQRVHAASSAGSMLDAADLEALSLRDEFGWGEILGQQQQRTAAAFGQPPGLTVATPLPPPPPPSLPPPPGLHRSHSLTMSPIKKATPTQQRQSGGGGGGESGGVYEPGALDLDEASGGGDGARTGGNKPNGAKNAKNGSNNASSPGDHSGGSVGSGGGVSSREKPTRNLHVSRYGPHVTKQGLRLAFEKHSVVVDVVLKEHPAGGYAFVNTSSAEGAARARSALQGSDELDAKLGGLKINFAKDKFNSDHAPAAASASPSSPSSSPPSNKTSQGQKTTTSKSGGGGKERGKSKSGGKGGKGSGGRQPAALQVPPASKKAWDTA